VRQRNAPARQLHVARLAACSVRQQNERPGNTAVAARKGTAGTQRNRKVAVFVVPGVVVNGEYNLPPRRCL